MSIIRVLVHGATGRMGREVIAAVSDETGLQLVGGVCRSPSGGAPALTDSFPDMPLSSDLGSILEKARPQVVVDFTNAEACMSAARETLQRSICFITGSSGLKDEDQQTIGRLAEQRGIGAIVAPNFALGAALLMSLTRQAAPFFDYVDIIEAHHELKIDAPSGTAFALAKAISEDKEFIQNHAEKQTLAGTKGGEYRGVGIHSLRQPGRSAHHEVIFGAKGQTLTLRHDTLGRDCYMPGVIHSIREVVKLKGLVIGLDNLLSL